MALGKKGKRDATAVGVSGRWRAFDLIWEADDTYLTAVAAMKGDDSPVRGMTSPNGRAITQTGASPLSFNLSNVVIYEYSSLDARVDEPGVVVEYGRQAALVCMVELADQRAMAGLSPVWGQEPVQSIS